MRLDYYVWSTVEKSATHSACNSKVELMTKIEEVFEHSLKDTLMNECAMFRSRIVAVVEAEGTYLDYKFLLPNRNLVNFF